MPSRALSSGFYFIVFSWSSCLSLAKKSSDSEVSSETCPAGEKCGSTTRDVSHLTKCDPRKQYLYLHGGADGLGSQFYSKLVMKAHCANPRNNCVYVHEPMITAHHNYRGDANYEQHAEGFINLHHNAPLRSEMDKSCNLRRHFQMPNPRLFTKEVLKDLRVGYDSGLQPETRYINASAQNCVMYLRRGDMGPPSSARLTNKEAIQIFKKITKKYPNCVKYIFTQGEWPDGTPSDKSWLEGKKGVKIPSKSDSNAPWIDADITKPGEPVEKTFADVTAADPTIKMVFDGDVWGVFDAMASADVLIIDASKFPILAAMFNPNIVYYNAIDIPRLQFPYGGYEKYILGHWKKI